MSVDDVEAAFRDNYSRYQYCLVDFIAEHLADCSRAFNGDMQMAVLLAIVGQSYLSAMTVAETAGRSLDDLPNDRRGISTNRLSDVTGIPRETARRKLLEMERRGWLLRTDNLWHLALCEGVSNAQRELEGLDGRAVRRTARLFSLLAPLVQTDRESKLSNNTREKRPTSVGK